MTETVARLPENETEHPHGSVKWLIAQLNNADHIDGMVAEKLRAQSRALTASQETIDRLRDENERLRKALEDIADGMGETDTLQIGRWAPPVARAALHAD